MTTHQTTDSTDSADSHRAHRSVPSAAADARLVSVTTARVIATTPDRLWTVVADEFDTVGAWASTVDRSMASPGTPASNETDADRYCEVPGLGQTRERITAFDPVGLILGYVVEADGMPTFLRSVESTWRITPLDSGEAEVRLTIDARVGGASGRLLAPALRAQFRRTQRRVLADLDVYARSGQVSRRKARMTTDQ